jgi:hypothetical protein
MLALRLAEDAARRRDEAGGVICPWEVENDNHVGAEAALTVGRVSIWHLYRILIVWW